MKESTLHSLITARTLFDEALRLIESGDRHVCSAGLVMLQDALEIIFLAMLTEKGIDEQKSLESKGFDELIGELRKSIVVPKSGTLKALNKQRVIIKHYGQLAEPVTVRGYAEAAEIAVSSILSQVLGKTFREILLSDLLNEGEARNLLNEASANIERHAFLEALISVRKALFVEIEYEYAINKWANGESAQDLVLFWTKGGLKAPAWTKNRKWIEENVRDPLGFVQIDHERLRLDAMEWGVNTAELENIRRLTPEVFRPEKDGQWYIRTRIELLPEKEDLHTARYCLDRTVSILLRKQQHAKAKRWPRKVPFELPSVYLGAPVYPKASSDSAVVHHIQSDYTYSVNAIVTGFDPSESYYSISGFNIAEMFMGGFISGYLLIQEADQSSTSG